MKARAWLERGIQCLKFSVAGGLMTFRNGGRVEETLDVSLVKYIESWPITEERQYRYLSDSKLNFLDSRAGLLDRAPKGFHYIGSCLWLTTVQNPTNIPQLWMEWYCMEWLCMEWYCMKCLTKVKYAVKPPYQTQHNLDTILIRWTSLWRLSWPLAHRTPVRPMLSNSRQVRVWCEQPERFFPERGWSLLVADKWTSGVWW